jgi:hypothetical protein
VDILSLVLASQLGFAQIALIDHAVENSETMQSSPQLADKWKNADRLYHTLNCSEVLCNYSVSFGADGHSVEVSCPTKNDTLAKSCVVEGWG